MDVIDVENESELVPSERPLSLVRLASNSLKIYWKTIFAVTWLFLLLPVFTINNSKETRCAYVILLMGGYWMTECIPLAVTSTIPIVLFPLMGIMSTADTCDCYMNDTIMVFICGLILALATEYSRLHLRIALGVVKLVGCSHTKLLGSVCAVTTFISMWISNAATTAMMVPIVFAILYELEEQGLGTVFEVEKDPKNPNHAETKPSNTTLAYLFATAYASSFGGTGSLVGTPTNLAFKGIYENSFPEAEPINFGIWILMSFPQMCTNLVILWLYLRVVFLGHLRPGFCKSAQRVSIGAEGAEIANRILNEKFSQLGRMTFHETMVAIFFVICIFLWIFRKPGSIPGWSEYLTDTQLGDSMPAVLIILLMFLIPRNPIRYGCGRDHSTLSKASPGGLISWKMLRVKLPWGLVFLLGGGFAISKGSIVSCLAQRIGQALVPLENLSLLMTMAITCFITGTLGEITSNVGTANILLPIVAHMSVALKIHPLYLMIPVTLMSSFAFRMPHSTPPNAIITHTGRIKISTMMWTGCFPAFYSMIVEIIYFPTWGAFVFGIDGFPDWAKESQHKNNSCV